MPLPSAAAAFSCCCYWLCCKDCSWCCCSASCSSSPLLLPLVPLLLPPAPATAATDWCCCCRCLLLHRCLLLLCPLPPAAVLHSALAVLQLGRDVMQNVVCNTKSILFGTVITIPCKTIRKKKDNKKQVLQKVLEFYPQQQNAMGSLDNIDFGVFWARWSGSGKELGSGNRFQVSMGSAGRASRFRWVPTGSGVRKVVPRFEWVLTGSGFPRFAFRELVPGFDRFRGSESGNAVRRGIVKSPCCWGYHLRLFATSGGTF